MPLWDVLVSIFWFMILFAWIGLLIRIFGDIFRDHEMSGWAKALWSLFLIVVPWLGALVYLIARGPSMNRRARAQAQQNVRDFDQYVRETAASTSTGTADELAKLAELRDRGAISTEEFERAKAKVLGQEPVPAASMQRDERTVPVTT
jgi:hypothetical protein